MNATDPAAARRGADTLIQDARKELLSAIDGLSPEQMSAPALDDWSAKDLLAHIASWEEHVVSDLARVQRGHVPALAAFQESDVNTWNGLLVGLRRAFPLQQVLFEFNHYRTALLDALGTLDDSAFASGYVPSTLAICAWHDREHAGHIRAWREREGI